MRNLNQSTPFIISWMMCFCIRAKVHIFLYFDSWVWLLFLSHSLKQDTHTFHCKCCSIYNTSLEPGTRLIKDSLFRYGELCYQDKMVMRWSNLYSMHHYTGKMISLYWHGHQIATGSQQIWFLPSAVCFDYIVRLFLCNSLYGISEWVIINYLCIYRWVSAKKM